MNPRKNQTKRKMRKPMRMIMMKVRKLKATNLKKLRKMILKKQKKLIVRKSMILKNQVVLLLMKNLQKMIHHLIRKMMKPQTIILILVNHLREMMLTQINPLIQKLRTKKTLRMVQRILLMKVRLKNLPIETKNHRRMTLL